MNEYAPVKFDISKCDETATYWIMFADFAERAIASGWTTIQIEIVLREAYKTPSFTGKQAFLKTYCDPDRFMLGNLVKNANGDWVEEGYEETETYPWDEDDDREVAVIVPEIGTGSETLVYEFDE